jgi:catechol 2,3-dioxygenase-like lactoylglutathione lyase family enzyme
MSHHHALPEQRVTLITLGVRDLARARAFYRALGWRPVEENDRISFYQMQGAALALFGLADLADDQDRPVAELGTGALTLAQNFATEADVDSVWHRAMAAGARAIKQPQAVSWGGYSGYFADPDGHVWELAMNPFWPLAADGSLTLPEA